MGTFIDLTGKKFGRLTVLSRGDDSENTYGRPIVRWECACQCGKKTLVRSAKLTQKSTTSCGCFQREQLGRSRRKHGQAYSAGRRTKAYRAWAGAKNRCLNPLNARFIGDGSRGVKMCDRWLNSFENFYADMGEPPLNSALKRRNQNEDFTLENCHWSAR